MTLKPYTKFLGCDKDFWIGDGFCDDETNTEICQFDGGDCCGSNVNTQYCIECVCKSSLGCDKDFWIGDGFCDDETNTEVCQFDGGDCCGSNVNTSYCTECICY
jgi:hypothetical protein